MKPIPIFPGTARLLRDDRGSISIEFCVVFPLLLFLTISGLAFWDAFQSNSKTAKVAYTISDIMSRYDTVTSTDMDYLYALEDKLLPSGLTQRSIRVTSICFESGVYRVMWSYTTGSSDAVAVNPLTDPDIPLGAMPKLEPQDSVILTEVWARWNPKLHLGVGSMVWHSALVSSPRFVKIIPHQQLNASNICPSTPPPAA